jgi:Cys-rich repeat protein
MPRSLLLITFLTLACPGLSGCSTANSPACETDSDCGDGARCRFGGCGPICLADEDCGTEQVCSGGRCVAPPECSKDADCAEGFTCRAGTCACSGDAACAANQACVDGRCNARERCTTDDPCLPLGRRCELTQGICVPPCALPTDCAPGLDGRVATALFACQSGSCIRRCLGDGSCGTGLICDEGFCRAAACRIYADCPAGTYCTSATAGRCTPEVRCSADAACGPNERCRTFEQDACPPGFPCERAICQELPRCLSDADCAGLIPGFTSSTLAYCQDQHCQPTTACNGAGACAPGLACVGGACVPGPCRGDSDCAAAGLAPTKCVDATCTPVPSPSETASLQIHPARAWIVTGDSLTFHAVAYTAGGQAVPLPRATFELMDLAGVPSALGTIGADGVLQAAAAGELVVRASHSPQPGAGALPREARVTVVAPPVSGKTVYVLDVQQAPVEGADVVGCDAPPPAATCGSPVTVRTDASGSAHFPSFSGSTASFTVSPPGALDGGVPLLERTSVVEAPGALIFIPLGGERETGAAPFRGTTSFTSVHGTGTLWSGLTLLSTSDPADLELTDVVGEPFQAQVPGLGQAVPVPSNVVAYTSAAFGIPTKVKDTAYGQGRAGRRAAVAFAGKTDGAQLLNLRTVDLLAALGGLDVGLQGPVQVPHLPKVPDMSDVDGDGRCEQVQECPAGSELVADHANGAQLSLAPSRLQTLRTEVLLPPLPAGVDTALVIAAREHPEAGLIPLGLGSRTGGQPASDGTRLLQPVVLRSASPWGVAALGRPALWVHALSVNAQGAQVGRAATGTVWVQRSSTSPRMPEAVTPAPFLPLPAGGALSAGIFAAGGSVWGTAHAEGVRLARIVVQGSTGRHVYWLPLTAGRSAWPLLPGDAGDPVLDASRTVEVQWLALEPGLEGAALLDAPVPSLLDLSRTLRAYSRSLQ